MFALDLFNTDHERRLTEGAVDTLEQRRIDDLAMKMDDLVARAKKATTPEVKQALMKEFQKCKDERDSYYKIREGEVTRTATGLKHRGTKGYGADYDGSGVGSGGTNLVAPSTGRRTMPRLDHDANDAPNYEVDEETEQFHSNRVELFGKINRVIQSIQTPKQYANALGFVKRAFQKLNSDQSDEPTFSSKAIQRVLQDARALERDLAAKAQELGIEPQGFLEEEVADSYNTKQVKVFKDKSGKPIGEIGFDLDASPGNDDWYCWHYATGYNVLGFENAAEATRELRYVHKHPEAVSEAGIPGNVPTEKIPGKEDLLKGKGRSYYEADQKKNSEVNKDQRLHVGDPVIVTGPNEFEGKTGEISEFSTSGKFVVINLYNHGEHSMHLSDVKYNDYADQQDDWYDEEDYVEEDQGNGQVAIKAADDAVVDTMDEGWSDAIVARRTGQPRTPYSVYIKGKKWKDFANDDLARAVMDRLKAKFAADGRDPETITIAPTDYDKMSEGAVNPQFINVQVTKILAREAQRMTNAPIEQLLAPLMKEYNLTVQQINSMIPGGLKKAAAEYGVMVKSMAESSSDKFNSPEQLKKDADYRAYRAGVKASRKQPPASLPTKDVKETQLDEATARDVLLSLLDKFYADMKLPPRQGSHSGALDIKSPGTKVWTRGDGTRLREPGRIQASYWADDKKQAEKAAAKFWPWLLKQPGVKSIGQVSGQFGSSPMTDAVSYKGLYFSGGPYGTEFGSMSRVKNPKSVWRHKPFELEPKAEQGVAESASDSKNIIAKLMKPAFVDGSGGNFSYMLELKAPTMHSLREKYHDDLDAMFAHASKEELAQAAEELKALGWNPQEMEEGQTDYSKRRQREKDVDAGKPVAKQRTSKMTDYQKRRAQQKREMELGEGDISQLEKAVADAPVKPIANMESAYENQDTSGVEQAIIRRIMVAHTDLLKQFGPQKVMQAAEEVAYDVGDVDEIGTSDVSAYVQQVKRILGA